VRDRSDHMRQFVQHRNDLRLEASTVKWPNVQRLPGVDHYFAAVLPFDFRNFRGLSKKCSVGIDSDAGVNSGALRGSGNVGASLNPIAPVVSLLHDARWTVFFNPKSEGSKSFQDIGIGLPKPRRTGVLAFQDLQYSGAGARDRSPLRNSELIQG
jgi:hypothetical protein